MKITLKVFHSYILKLKSAMMKLFKITRCKNTDIQTQMHVKTKFALKLKMIKFILISSQIFKEITKIQTPTLRGLLKPN